MILDGSLVFSKKKVECDNIDSLVSLGESSHQVSTVPSVQILTGKTTIDPFNS